MTEGTGSASGQLLTDAARAWIGRLWDFGSHLITADRILKHVVATGEMLPIHLDRAAARAAGHRDIVAPPMLYRTLGRPVVPLSELTVDGVTEDRRPPVGKGRALAGEVAVDFFSEICCGDVISVKCRLTELQEKRGRSGEFVVATWVTEFRDQDDRLVVLETSKNLLQ